jgi:HAE1 family hydrophobic/amphiphilic exporter-1
LQKLAEICIRRPVFATMIILSLVVVGAAGFFRLGVDRFPAVDLPTVSVRVGLPGAAPEEVESLISDQVEEVINTVDGISELRSISGQGSSIVIATFNLDRDLESAAQDVRDRVSTLGRRLPQDATPPAVQKFDNDSAPVLTIALTADRSIRELTELADKTARPQLERIAGVGEVRVVGGLNRAINVWPRKHRRRLIQGRNDRDHRQVVVSIAPRVLSTHTKVMGRSVGQPRDGPPCRALRRIRRLGE